jgi:hypothetical protein
MVNLQIENDPDQVLITLERTAEGQVWIRANGTLLMTISQEAYICLNVDVFKDIFDRVPKIIANDHGEECTVSVNGTLIK